MKVIHAVTNGSSLNVVDLMKISLVEEAKKVRNVNPKFIFEENTFYKLNGSRPKFDNWLCETYELPLVTNYETD